MPAKKTERITIRLTPSMKAQLKSEARKDKRSLSQFCEIVFTMGLLNHATELAKQSKEVSA